MAARRGHIKMVQWFYNNNIPADISKAINGANDGGHAEVRGFFSFLSFYAVGIPSYCMVFLLGLQELLSRAWFRYLPNSQ